MPCVSVESLFSRKGIWSNSELKAEGVQYRDLAPLLDSGAVVRPVFKRQSGPIRGIFVSRDLDRDPERGLIVAVALTGGVIGRHTAGFRYGLTTDTPRRVEVHVNVNYTRVPVQALITAMRSRRDDMRRIGVDYVDTEFGVQIPITTPARTVVDIMHSGRSDTRDYEHGLAAIETFLENGGEPGEIIHDAEALGLDPDDRIKLAVNAVEMGRGGRMRP